MSSLDYVDTDKWMELLTYPLESYQSFQRRRYAGK